MKKVLIHDQTTNLLDLIEYSRSNWHPGIKANGYVRYMSSGEQETSKILKDDWDYYINHFGYRGSWRLEKDTKKIGFFGCSCTFGIGMHHNYIFPNLIERHYGSSSIESLNMGLPGASIQRVAKLFSAANRIIDFDIVVLTLPSSSRFLISNADNGMADIIAGSNQPSLHKVNKFIYGTFGQNSLDMYFIDYVHWIKAELKSTQRVLWSSWCRDTYILLQKIINKEDLAPIWQFVDKARDNHPGILSHKNYATHIVDKIGKL